MADTKKLLILDVKTIKVIIIAIEKKICNFDLNDWFVKSQRI